MLILNCSYYSLFSLQFLDFPEDQTKPDQTGLNRIRLDLCHIRTHTAFFKVKCINLAFTNYILVYLQVSVFRGDSKSFFMSYMKAFQECIKWNAVKVDLVSPDQCWKWTQRFGTHTLSGSAASVHSNVRN